MQQGLYDKAREFVKKIDPSSWPVFFMFLVVLLAAGGLNYITMAPIVGGWVAVFIAAFFGIGVLSWHITESRTDDSKYQDDVAGVVKWANAGFDALLIIVNLFRAELPGNYDTTAFVIIGISAASHVVGYLLWTENAPARLLQKSKARIQQDLDTSLNDLDKKSRRANIAIQTTEEHMKKLKWINDESIRLRKEYGGVAGIDVEGMIKAMKSKALAEFEDVKPEDVTAPAPLVFAPVKAAETVQAELKEPNPTNRQSQK